MRIITIQNKKVSEIIRKEGIYVVDRDKSQYNSYGASYEKMRSLMGKHLNIKTLPIWGFLKIHDMTPSLDLNCPYYIGKGAIIDENSVLLELEVDESMALIMDYYKWTDYMYFLGEGNTVKAEKSLSALFEIENADTIQVCIPYIKKSMLICEC